LQLEIQNNNTQGRNTLYVKTAEWIIRNEERKRLFVDGAIADPYSQKAHGVAISDLKPVP